MSAVKMALRATAATIIRTCAQSVKSAGLDEPARQRGADDGADEHDHKVGKQ